MKTDTINLQPQLPTLDARSFDQLCQLWLEDCRARIAKRTIEGYEEKLSYARDWWVTKGPVYNWVMSEAVIQDFAHWLEQQISRFNSPLGYHTRRDAHRRLRQVFLWAWKRGYVAHNYSKWVPAPNGSAPLRKAPPVDCLRRLIEAAERSPYPVRDRAILAVLLGTGVRRGECTSIRVSDVQIDADGSGVITVKAKKVKGREIHARHVAFDAATGGHIRKHLDAMKDCTGPLFLSRRYDQVGLTNIGIYRVVKRLIALAGLDDQIQGPHDLRRYFATYYSRHRRGEGHGHLLSKQLGHATYRMTAQYSLPDVEDLRGAVFSVFALLEEPSIYPSKNE